jgi:hypothetical protein
MYARITVANGYGTGTAEPFYFLFPHLKPATVNILNKNHKKPEKTEKTVQLAVSKKCREKQSHTTNTVTRSF